MAASRDVRSWSPEERPVLVPQLRRVFFIEGASVLVTGATAKEISQAKSDMPGITAKMLDVRDGAAVRSLVRSLDFLDHVVNCAGTIRAGPNMTLKFSKMLLTST